MKNKFENYADSRLIHELKSKRDILYKPWFYIIIIPFILLIAEVYGINLMAVSSLAIEVVFLLILVSMTWMGYCLVFIYGLVTAIRDEEKQKYLVQIVRVRHKDRQEPPVIS